MNAPSRSNKKPPLAAQLGLSAIDPGMIRLRGATRAALAVFSIWLVLRPTIPMLFSNSEAPLPLLGVLSGIIFLLFIIDLKPSDRRISLLLAPFPFAVAFLLASFFEKYFWLNNLVLMSLFFFSYFFRRYGTRAGELTLVATIGYYFGFLFHPPATIIPGFLNSLLVSVSVVYLWQFVILPYDPVRSLHHSIRAFYHNVATSVATLQRVVQVGKLDDQSDRQLKRQLQRVHQNRRVIESLFSATVSPSIWSQPRLNRLQSAMFKTERSLELLAENISRFANLPDRPSGEILSILAEDLGLLEADLWHMSSQESPVRLSDLGDLLQSQVKSHIDQAPLGEWVYPLLRIGIASGQLAYSVVEINKIETSWVESKTNEPQIKPSLHISARPIDASWKKPSSIFHPTTDLGLQAIFATGLAMLAAYLLQLDQPNLVYWTAFVVIAGTTGESLRRITLRVLGIIAGTLVGVLLAVILPEDLILVVLCVAISIFLTVFMIPISYIRMVFWLNIAILLVITTIGGPALDLLVIRPLNTLIGAVIAALVVVFVLPIHVQDRFSVVLSAFLKEVDRYIEVYVGTLLGTLHPDDLEAQELNIESNYRKLELTLPGVVYEYNPLSRAQNRLTSQVTTLAVLRSYVAHLRDDIGAEPGSLVGLQDAGLLSVMQSRIHQAIEAVNNYHPNQQTLEINSTSGVDDQARQEEVLREIFSTEPGSIEAQRNRALYHLTRIHDTILQFTPGKSDPD